MPGFRLPRVASAHRRVARLGAVAAVSMLLTLLWAPSAAAAPALTIALDPPEVMVMPWPTENYGPLTLANVDSDAYTPIPVQWGGTLTLQLPSTLDGSAMEVWLGLAPTDEDPPSLEFATDNSPPDLTVNDLGGGQYEVELPPDDTINGPVGYLTFDGLGSPISGVEVMPADYLLEFDAANPAAVNVTPDLMALTSVPCALSSPTRCPPYELTPGDQFTLDVPASSPLRQLGLGSLDATELYLSPVDGDGWPAGDDIELAVGAQALAAEMAGSLAPGAPAAAEPPSAVAALAEATDPAGPGVVDLAAAGAVAAASTPYTATVTVPDSVPAGSYVLSLLETGASGGMSISTLEMEIQALPRANRGLRSDTGWVEPTLSSSPGAPLIAVGGGLVLIAGLGTAVVLQGRRPDTE